VFPGFAVLRRKYDENEVKSIEPVRAIERDASTYWRQNPVVLIGINRGHLFPGFSGGDMQHKGEKCNFEEATCLN
jgi:hypothetical protein